MTWYMWYSLGFMTPFASIVIIGYLSLWCLPDPDYRRPGPWEQAQDEALRAKAQSKEVLLKSE